MRKIIKLGVLLAGSALITNAFAVDLPIPLFSNFCTSTTDSTCTESATVPGLTSFSTATINGLKKRNPTAVVAVVGGSTPSIFWGYSNSQANNITISMTSSTVTVLNGAASGNNTKLNLATYYVACGSTPPSDGAAPGSLPGTQLTSGGSVSIAGVDDGTNLGCSPGGNLYYVLTPSSLPTNKFLPADTYSGNVDITVTTPVS